jgi:hypothetical protein
MVVGRIAVRQVAADGGEVAYYRIGDDLRGVVEQGIARPDQLGLFQLRFARERADPEKPMSLTDARQTRDSVDVHDVRGVREPELHQRDEALASREDLGVLAEPDQERRRLADRGRCVIVERGRNHRRGLLQAGILGPPRKIPPSAGRG